MMNISFLARRALLLCILLACMARVTLAADPQPPEGVRTLLTELVVQVRTSDADSGQEIESGCGLIIGCDDTAVTILTARHVIDEAMKTGPRAKVSVLFSGATNWRDCEPGAPLHDVDAAFLRVKRADAPFSAPPRCAQIVISPPPPAGSQVYVFGLNPSTKKLEWRAGVFNSSNDSVDRFDCDGVVGGYSGGLLVSPIGVIAMTVKAGPAGKDHEALELPPLLRLIKEAGGAVLTTENQAVAALERLFAEKLVGAINVWDLEADHKKGESFWLALSPMVREGDSYQCEGITVRTREKLKVSANGPNLNLSVSSDIEGIFRSNSKLVPGEYSFNIDPETAMPGFLVLKSATPEYLLYLALPTQHVELLPARAMVEACMGASSPKMEDEFVNAFEVPELPYANRAPMPFSMVVSARSFLEFRVPVGNHRHQKIVITGRSFVPDRPAVRRDKAEQLQKAWTNLKLQVASQHAEDKALASAPFLWPAGNLQLTLQPTDDVLRIGCSPLDRREHGEIGNHFLLVRGLTLEYKWQ